MKIRTKAEFLRLSAAGMLGNRMPSWPDVAAAAAAGHRGAVMIRSREPDSPWMRPDVPLREVGATIDAMVAAGARRDAFYLTWQDASVGRRLNAEAWRGPGGLHLHYADGRESGELTLRPALDRHGRHASGSAATAILRHCCCPASVDDLEAIWGRYPDACIELTAFDREVGDIAGRNTVVWEVRDY